MESKGLASKQRLIASATHKTSSLQLMEQERVLEGDMTPITLVSRISDSARI